MALGALTTAATFVLVLVNQRGCKNIRTTNYHTLPSFRNISILSRLLVT